MEEIKGETQERERSLRELLVSVTRIVVHVDKFEDDDSMRQGVQFSGGPSFFFILIYLPDETQLCHNLFGFNV